MIDFDPTTIPLGHTYGANGNVLTYRDSDGYWYKYTRDAAGRVLTCRDSYGYWYRCTRDAAGRVLMYRDNYTYDAAGRCAVTKLFSHEAHNDCY